MNWINSEKHRKFGITFSIFFLLVSALLFWRGHGAAGYFFMLSALFFVVSAFYPRGLKIAETGWMKFAEALLWFNTRLILGILFYVIFTPVGFLLSLCGKDFLSLKIEPTAVTYWVKREKVNFSKEDYEKIF